MPAPQTQSLNFLGPKELSTKPTRPCFIERNSDGTMTNVDAARIKPSTGRELLLARRPAWSRGRAKPLPSQLRLFRRDLPPPRHARWVLLPKRHGPDTTLSCLAAFSTWLSRRGSSSRHPAEAVVAAATALLK